MAKSDKPHGDWRDAGTFKQGERYSGESPNRGEKAGAKGPSAPLMPLVLAGLAMIVSTLALRAAGAGGAVAFLFGVAAFVVALVALYEKPTRQKTKRTVAPGAGYDAAQVAAKLEGAEAELIAIEAASRKLPQDLRSALGEMTNSARKVLDTIAKDPLDLDRARKFIVAYLPSARRAVEKYVGLGVRDSELDQRFRALVEEMSETCRKQEETLRSDDVFDLEVEMDTLTERLRAEN